MNIPGPQPLLFAGGSCCYFGDGGKGWMDHPKAKSRAKQCHPVGHSYAGHLYLCLLQIYLNFNNCESFDAFFLSEICQIYVPIDILTLSPCWCFIPISRRGGLLGWRHDWRFGQSGFEGRKWFHALVSGLFLVETGRVLEISSPCYIVWICLNIRSFAWMVASWSNSQRNCWRDLTLDASRTHEEGYVSETKALADPKTGADFGFWCHCTFWVLVATIYFC